jgi:hypothetical protein
VISSTPPLAAYMEYDEKKRKKIKEHREKKKR